jgi:hypothetical protein
MSTNQVPSGRPHGRPFEEVEEIKNIEPALVFWRVTVRNRTLPV